MLLLMGTTSSGLPYPDPTDRVTQGAAAIQALAEAVDDAIAALPRGRVGSFTPGTSGDFNSVVDINGTTFPLVAGRRYRVSGASRFLRTAGTVTLVYSYLRLIRPDVSNVDSAELATSMVNDQGSVPHVYEFTATTTGTAEVILRARADGGGTAQHVNGVYVVEDIGAA